jgi:hypothetical protein
MDFDILNLLFSMFGIPKGDHRSQHSQRFHFACTTALPLRKYCQSIWAFLCFWLMSLCSSISTATFSDSLYIFRMFCLLSNHRPLPIDSLYSFGFIGIKKISSFVFMMGLSYTHSKICTLVIIILYFRFHIFYRSINIQLNEQWILWFWSWIFSQNRNYNKINFNKNNLKLKMKY